MPASILDDFRLDGKIALVTGAATGLGQAMACGLAEAGAVLALTTRDSPLENTVNGVSAWGVGPLCLRADLSQPAERETLIERTIERFGRIDILINNAGTTSRHPAEQFPLETWLQVVEINMNAVFHLCQLAGRSMLRQGHGKIINIASLLSFSGGILVPAYAASKGAVGQLTKALANEWARRGVNVNAIAPGYFRTRMGEPLFQDSTRMQQILDRIPAGSIGEPSQLKGAVVYLASAASDYVHGHILVVDGGWMAR